jgi:Family of unknown function (DUF5302)
MSPTERPDTTPAEEPAGPTEDVREKFRAALARKQGREHGVPHHPDADQAGPAPRSQEAKPQRMFRRKSG